MQRISHKYLSLPLIPVEEFFELYPEHRELDEHELMIARINHEHAEREKLEQARQELLKRKQALIAENKKRKDDLANLDQDLEKFIDVCTRSFLSFCDISLIDILFLPGGQTNPEDLREGVLDIALLVCAECRVKGEQIFDCYIGSALLVKIPVLGFLRNALQTEHTQKYTLNRSWLKYSSPARIQEQELLILLDTTRGAIGIQITTWG